MGVEGRVPQGRNDDGILLDHAPAQTVRGDQPPQELDVLAGRQGPPLVGDGLVTLPGIRLGVSVLDDGDRPPNASRHGPDQVVVLRSLMLDQAQIGLHPVDSVQALGVGAVDGLLHHPGPVPHPVAVSILHDHRVVDGVVLPGTIPPQDDLSRLRAVEDVSDVLQAFDEPIVPQRLKLASQLAHLRGGREGDRRKQPEEDAGPEAISAWMESHV